MQNYFKRYEKKYMIDMLQYELLMHFIEGKINEDKRTNYNISNIYYDTKNYDLIRTSIEKPVYKEKLRLREYEIFDEKADINESVYIELKKKVDGIVYKRRIKCPKEEAIEFLDGGRCPAVKPKEENILKEIIYFLERNAISPKALITYNRKAFHGINDRNFRMTFDSNIIYRNMNDSDIFNRIERPVLESEKMIMEIKSPESIPVWLSKIMSELDIFPITFSKYGVAYKTYVARQMFMTRDSLLNGERTEEVNLSA